MAYFLPLNGLKFLHQKEDSIDTYTHSIEESVEDSSDIVPENENGVVKSEEDASPEETDNSLGYSIGNLSIMVLILQGLVGTGISIHLARF